MIKNSQHIVPILYARSYFSNHVLFLLFPHLHRPFPNVPVRIFFIYLVLFFVYLPQSSLSTMRIRDSPYVLSSLPIVKVKEKEEKTRPSSSSLASKSSNSNSLPFLFPLLCIRYISVEQVVHVYIGKTKVAAAIRHRKRAIRDTKRMGSQERTLVAWNLKVGQLDSACSFDRSNIYHLLYICFYKFIYIYWCAP